MTYSTYYQFVHFIADSNKIQATEGSSQHLRTLKVKPMNPRILNQVIFDIFITCVIHNQIQCGKVIYLFIVRFWLFFFFLQTPVLDVNSSEEGMAERTIV